MNLEEIIHEYLDEDEGYDLWKKVKKWHKRELKKAKDVNKTTELVDKSGEDVKTREKIMIKQIRSFLHSWHNIAGVEAGKEEEYQEMAEEIYWKAIHENLTQELKKAREEMGKALSYTVNKKFPRGERKWCIDCARRIRKAVKNYLKGK